MQRLIRLVGLLGRFGRSGLLALLLLGGCGGDPLQGQTLPPGPCAVEGVTGTLPGVTLAIRSESCVYRAGETAHFTYEAVTDATVPPIDLPASAGCGSCNKPTADPGTWIRWSITGTSPDGIPQHYCLCDFGCCPPDRPQTLQPAAGAASGTIDWPGRSWDGPSDYNAPLGDVFPPGLYRVEVTFPGHDRGSVTAALPIEIVPAH